MTAVSKALKLACRKSELRLDITLQCGQSFRWREVEPGRWRGMIAGRVWTLSQDDTHITCLQHLPHHLNNANQDTTKTLKISNDNTYEKQNKTRKSKKTNNTPNDSDQNVNDISKNSKLDDTKQEYLTQNEAESVVHKYFQLGVSLEDMYRQWAAADANFARVCPQFPGVRMLNQDPVENVFSFICSSNNNIQRITLLVERLCQLYGRPAATVDGTTWHSFPGVEALAAPDVEDTLRNNGFGYRAKYISKSAQMILAKGGEEWLASLRGLPYDQCHAQLVTLNGIGAKVSDCICLMSMGHLGAIPVDTHVFQIAARDYLPHLKACKTVTDKVYKEIANHFRTVFGEYAGWAHSVLFSADLKKFDNLKEEDQNETAKNKKKIKKQ